MPWKQTLLSLDLTLKIHSNNSSSISDNLIIRDGQPIEDFDTDEFCPLCVTTMKTIIFQDDIPSIPIDIIKDHLVIVFDLTSMQEATENCHYTELVGEPLRLELNFTFPLEHVSRISILGNRKPSVAVSSLASLWRISKMDHVALEQVISRILLLKYRNFVSFSADSVPTLLNETFAIMKT